MADKVQAIAHIRFALERLSERNAQHEWEHLCRYFAQQRISPNILPATGPVQAGGDQGRDFETFQTFISRNPLNMRYFMGLSDSNKPIAFACTLEKRMAPKIKGDVATIMTSGTHIEGIYVFCTRGLPVAKRHQLQAWAREQYSVSLTILDGEAMSEALVERDVLWLVERYLEIPAEVLPQPDPEDDGQDWYAQALSRWQQETRPAQSYADFAEIKAAARAALGPFSYDEQGLHQASYERPELPFWIARLDEIAGHTGLDKLRRQALYEASVLRLRGLGSLVGQEHRLRAYFGEIPQLQSATDLEDAQVLLTYMLGSPRRGHVDLQKSEVRAWFAAVERRLDACIADAARDGRVNEHCMLLETRGNIAMFHDLRVGGDNTDAALRYWSELAKLAAHAPLFPLEAFSNRLTNFARFGGVHPLYDSVTEAIDALLGRRFGQFKVAEQCLARAKALREAGELPRAMALLHRAKIDWFAKETLAKSIQALDYLCTGYSEQGLFFAAKYYALAGAFITLHNGDLHLKRGIAYCLGRAALADYGLGAWHGFLELAEASAIFYPHYAPDPVADFNRPDSVFHLLMYHLGMVRTLTPRLHPRLSSFALERVTGIVKRVGFADVMDEIAAHAQSVWETTPVPKLWETVEEQLAGAPWGDADPMRSTEWQALGIRWRVQWENDYETTLIGEGFLAFLQVFLSDLAGEDLCLLPSTLDIALHVVPRGAVYLGEERSDYEGFGADFEASNEGQRAHVALPPYSDFRSGALTWDDLETGSLTAACILLQRMSFLPIDRFYEIVNERFAEGLPNKLVIGAPYAKCLHEFVDQEVFSASARPAHVPLTPTTPFTPRLPDALPWVDGPGPAYTPEEAEQQIANRYFNFCRLIPHTLRRLAGDRNFQEVLSPLRADGWKDWHVLAVVYHVTVNYRINHRPRIWLSPDAEEAYAQRIAHEPESSDALSVPMEEYREEALRQQLPLYLIAFAKTWALEIHQHTPDIKAIEHFLACRYGFWSDDVEHLDPFVA